MSKPSSFKGGRRDLPPDWPKLRQQVFARDGHQCTATLPKSGKRCPRGRATGHKLECDHIGSKWDHRLEMLTTLCVKHHADKTAQQGVAARTRKQSGRPEERHPGLRRKGEA